MEQVYFKDLGSIDYQRAWDYQTELHQQLVQLKLKRRREPDAYEVWPNPPHHLLFCEHPPVYTLGKSGSMDHLLLDEKGLAEEGFSFYKINRGGDITYHGPGQIVGYPILDMEYFFRDIHKYIRLLEEAIILTLDQYGLEGIRVKGYTGVWLDETAKEPKRKICAIGVHLSRWVTMHGFAFNVNSNLSHFKNIVPCGIDDKDKSVTSLAAELGMEIDIEEVKELVKKHLADLFQFEYLQEDFKPII